MRYLRFTASVLLLLTALMVWQAKTADAHGLENHTVYAPSPVVDHEAPVAEEQRTQSARVYVATQQQEEGCDGTCCMNSMCCSPAAIPMEQTLPFHKPAAFEAVLVLNSLPQGPPYTLLRPPKFSA